MKNLRQELETYRNEGLAGDTQAAAKCESRIGDGLRRVIRRTLTRGRDATALTEFILEQARRVREELGYQRDELVAEVATRLVAAIAGLGFQGRVDTVQANGESTVVRTRSYLSYRISRDASASGSRQNRVLTHNG